MNKNIKIAIPTEVDSLSLRAINEHDLEYLRQWKNEQREFFFHKDIITPEQQRAWFAKFQVRNHDYMFIVDLNCKAIGCMGKAFQTMLTFAQSVKKCPITLQVLKSNPAVVWYTKNGFVAIAEHADHYSLIYQSNTI